MKINRLTTTNVFEQCLAGHAEYISKDSILLRSDILTIIDILIVAAASINKKKIQLRTQRCGVAVYKRIGSACSTISVQFELPASHQVKLRAMFYIEEIIVTQLNMLYESEFIMATIYVHQRVTTIAQCF